MFYTRNNNITIIAVLDPALPQTVEQCKTTFAAAHGELDWLYTDDDIDANFSDAYLGSNNYDLTQCKEIKKNMLRSQRKPLLEAQDVAFQRALESGSSTTAIIQEKQRLRDITNLCDAATSLEELKTINISNN